MFAYHVRRRCLGVLLDAGFLTAASVGLQAAFGHGRLVIAIVSSVVVVYQVGLITWSGQTFGMRLARIQVRSSKEDRLLTFGESLKRAIVDTTLVAGYALAAVVNGENSIDVAALDSEATWWLRIAIGVLIFVDLSAAFYSREARQNGGTLHDLLANSRVVKVQRI